MMTSTATSVTVGNENWIEIVRIINSKVRLFKRVLKQNDQTENTVYINEWNELYSNVMDEYYDNNNVPYELVKGYLFGDPTTLLEFAQETLKIVPPIKEILQFKRSSKNRGKIELTTYELNADIIKKMIEIHTQFISANEASKGVEDDEGVLSQIPSSLEINTEFKNQVDQLEIKLDEATQALKNEMAQLESNLPSNIQSAVAMAFETALTKSEERFGKMQNVLNTTEQKSAQLVNQIETTTEELQEVSNTITETQRNMTKLTGEIKRASKTIDDLQNKANTVATQTTSTTDKAIRDYVQAKSDLQTKIMETHSEIQDAQDKAINQVKTYATALPIPDTTSTPSTHSSGKPYKSYPDEYMINGELNVIRVKKFQEDKTQLHCKSNDELTMMYSLLVQVSKQYGIHVTPAIDLVQWDMQIYSRPPTFPLKSMSFDDKDKLDNAYTTMSLALATKLKESVKFHESYMAAKMAVNSYSNDSYIMLYHLMKNVHPKLQRNKATKPKKPIFAGDINAFILKFKNWLAYQEQRDKPHVYDDDEIADDILAAIKATNWASTLTKGIEHVETKLDRWKNSTEPELPDELKIDFIGHTLMTPYVEANHNPFQSTGNYDGGTRDRGRATIRSAYQRGRSRSNQRFRTRSNSRNRSRSNSTGSNRPTRECNICGERHLETTTGCPHLYRHMNIQDYVRTTSRRAVEDQVREIKQDRRQRSTSRESNRSTNSNRSQYQD